MTGAIFEGFIIMIINIIYLFLLVLEYSGAALHEYLSPPKNQPL